MRYTLGAHIDKTRTVTRYPAGVANLPMNLITDISMLPRLDQGQQEACVGHAGANGVNYDYYKKTGNIPESSARWNYGTAKVIDKNLNPGTSATSMFTAWQDFGGSATTNTVPNDVTLSILEYTNLTITGVEVKDAVQYPVKNEVDISNPTSEQLMSLLSQYGVVLIALEVDEMTWMNRDGQGTLLPGTAGGHEVLLYGYETIGNDIKFHILNSWGASWGQNGCGSFLWSSYNGHVYDAMSVQINLSQPVVMKPTVQQSTLTLIGNFEGCSLTPYQDQGGIWTIGYGFTEIDGVPVSDQTAPLTLVECNAMLAPMVAPYGVCVNSAITVSLNQNQFDACCSLCYNIGTNGFSSSTVVRECNAENFTLASEAFLLWNKVNGVISQNLVSRRNKEMDLFLTV